MKSMIDEFSKTLAPFVASGEVSDALIGDLDDLLGTVEQMGELLRIIAGQDAVRTTSEIKSQFFRLLIMLEQDLPMIVDDVLPPLRKLVGEQ